MDIMTPRKWDQGPKRKCTNGPHGILIGFSKLLTKLQFLDQTVVVF